MGSSEFELNKIVSTLSETERLNFLEFLRGQGRNDAAAGMSDDDLALALALRHALSNTPKN